MSLHKPRLAELILDKLTRQIAGATRLAQRKLEAAEGKGAFWHIFAAADELVIRVHNVVAGIHGTQEIEGRNRKKVPSHAQHTATSGDGAAQPSDVRWPPYAEALAEFQSSSDTQAASTEAELPCESGGPSVSEAQLQLLLVDRWECIKPVLEAELKEALGFPVVHCVPSIPKHVATIRRNVSAHGRRNSAALTISKLSPSELRQRQKVARADHSLGNSELALRVSAIECELGRLRAVLGGDFFVAPGEQSEAAFDDGAGHDSLNKAFLETLNVCTHGFATAYSRAENTPGLGLCMNVNAPIFVPARDAPVSDTDAPLFEDAAMPNTATSAHTMAVAGAYNGLDVGTHSMSHCERSDCEASMHTSERDPNQSDCEAVAFVIGDADVSVQATPDTCEAGIQASCDQGPLMDEKSVDPNTATNGNGALTSRCGKGRTGTTNGLQNLLERSVNILQSRVPRRHADYRSVRDSLQELLTKCHGSREVHTMAAAVLARLEEV